MTGATGEAGFGVYVHWPYCSAICPYCDFNVRRARGEDSAPLLDAIVRDLARHAAQFGRRAAQTVFFGGGTPSLLSAADIGRVLEAVAKTHGLAPDAEITLEANPEDWPRFAEQAGAGINRFSIGVQALDDAALRALGRRHSAADAIAAVEAASGAGRRVSIDLIYARQGQDADAWARELARALALPIEHASLYQLTIEAGTAFARAVRRGALHPPAPAQAAALYEMTQEVAAAHGMRAYEISNHARDAAAQSRHNLIYWRGGDWLGVGPGAHGRITLPEGRAAIAAARAPAAYIAETACGPVRTELLSEDEAQDEALLMGLRLCEGLARTRLARQPRAGRLGPLIEEGLVTATPERLALTARGRLFADRIALELAL